MDGWQDGWMESFISSRPRLTIMLDDHAWRPRPLLHIVTSLNPVPNAQVCVYLTVHITKLQLQNTFLKPLYISHSACIHGTLAAENLDVCTTCDPWDSNIQLTMVKDQRRQIYPKSQSLSRIQNEPNFSTSLMHPWPKSHSLSHHPPTTSCAFFILAILPSTSSWGFIRLHLH